MIATITKEFRFEAAHYLPNHDGKCRHPHGHSYRLQVSARGSVAQEGPKEGMVLDFADIKEVWQKHLEPVLDHRDLNAHFSFTTTAEQLAAWICTVFQNNGIPVSMVRLWETSSAFVEVMPSDLRRAV